MTIQNVAIVGANGHLGPSILEALITSQKFKITVLSRSSSKSTFPSSVTVKCISDEPTHADLVETLRGQDALILTFYGSNDKLQIQYADAAAEAGVKRVLPADFGSCDSSSPRALELVPLYIAKAKVREHLIRLASRSSLTWTSLVCGHFFDYGIKSGLLGYDVSARKARIFDGGDIKFSASTLAKIGKAVVAVLEREEETRNRMLYMQSFCVTQNEVLKILEAASGGKWEVEDVKSVEYIGNEKNVLDEDPKNAEATENMVGVLGVVDANWEGKGDFANGLLKLGEEDLERVVKKVVQG